MAVIPLPDDDVIESEACAWLAQVDGGNMSDGDIAALKEWIGRSPRHRQVFERMASHFIALSGSFEGLPQAGRAPVAPARLGGWLRGWRLGALAACAAAVAVAAAVIAPRYLADPMPVAGVTRSYSAQLGEQKAVTLADGSKLLLNTRTRVDVAYSAQERGLYLAYGEALFDVAEDPSRPFRVYTQKGVVKAVGTLFSVRVRETEVEVLVAEGTVELATKAPQPGDSAADGATSAPAKITKLGSGKRAAFNETHQEVTDIAPEIMDRRLAWRQGVLIFDSDPLSYVVEEVSRYTDTKIVIADPRLLDMPIGGNFKVGETQALLDALEKGFGVKVEKINNNLVYLMPKG
ncbi:MAG: DUF4880 domain-containing protein [Alphaproteobacteria bacterium]|nr:MAG: DUF4880 domain-containing protein [Alphaproteobacteria bacterium]